MNLRSIKLPYLFILFALVVPMFSYAHEIKQVGTFDILLHLEPEDSPIAREVGQMYFSVTDSLDQFSFADCDCRVAISSGTNVLLDRKLTAQDEAPDWGVNVSLVEFVYPSRGIYVVTLEGASKTDQYDPFKLDYDVRIERESSTQPAVDPLPEESSLMTNYYVIGGAIIIFGIIIYEVFNKTRKKKKK